MYTAEVSTPSLKSFLGSACSLGVCLGITLVYVLGAFLHWFYMTLVCAAFPLISFILMFFCPGQSSQ